MHNSYAYPLTVSCKNLFVGNETIQVLFSYRLHLFDGLQLCLTYIKFFLAVFGIYALLCLFFGDLSINLVAMLMVTLMLLGAHVFLCLCMHDRKAETWLPSFELCVYRNFFV